VTSVKGFASVLRYALAAAALGFAALPAAAAPRLTVFFFMADWCSNCRVIEPELTAALDAAGKLRPERVDLDMTATRGGTTATFADASARSIRALETLRAAYLWDYYGGVTGVAVIVANDSGEALACITRLQDREKIGDLIERADQRLEAKPVGERLPKGAVPENCP
jgi:thiol-disulfide isomerase/thioredoxin